MPRPMKETEVMFLFLWAILSLALRFACSLGLTVNRCLCRRRKRALTHPDPRRAPRSHNMLWSPTSLLGRLSSVRQALRAGSCVL
jgi:hypothetical protein